MTVAELIQALSALPPDAPIGYINRCADDGSDFRVIDCAEAQTRRQWHQPPDGMPLKGQFVVLS